MMLSLLLTEIQLKGLNIFDSTHKGNGVLLLREKSFPRIQTKSIDGAITSGFVLIDL